MKKILLTLLFVQVSALHISISPIFGGCGDRQVKYKSRLKELAGLSQIAEQLYLIGEVAKLVGAQIDSDVATEKKDKIENQNAQASQGDSSNLKCQKQADQFDFEYKKKEALVILQNINKQEKVNDFKKSISGLGINNHNLYEIFAKKCLSGNYALQAFELSLLSVQNKDKLNEDVYESRAGGLEVKFEHEIVSSNNFSYLIGFDSFISCNPVRHEYLEIYELDFTMSEKDLNKICTSLDEQKNLIANYKVDDSEISSIKLEDDVFEKAKLGKKDIKQAAAVRQKILNSRKNIEYEKNSENLLQTISEKKERSVAKISFSQGLLISAGVYGGIKLYKSVSFDFGLRYITQSFSAFEEYNNVKKDIDLGRMHGLMPNLRLSMNFNKMFSLTINTGYGFWFAGKKYEGSFLVREMEVPSGFDNGFWFANIGLSILLY